MWARGCSCRIWEAAIPHKNSSVSALPDALFFSVCILRKGPRVACSVLSFNLSNTKPTSPQSTVVLLKGLLGPSSCQRGPPHTLKLTNRLISLLWSSIYLSAIEIEIFRDASFSFRSSAAKMWAEGCVQWSPGLLLAALNVPCSHRGKFPCSQAGNSLSLLLGSSWKFQQAEAVTKSNCRLWWFASLTEAVWFPSGKCGTLHLLSRL